jgi:hypothetical protein
MTSTTTSSDSNDIYDDSIDVDVLYHALYQLLPTFEIKESLMNSLINEIFDSKHVCFNDQFIGVREWVDKHAAGVHLSPDEVYNVIKYVELYQHLPDTETTGAEVDDQAAARGSDGSNAIEIDTESSEEAVACGTSWSVASLMCPYRSDVAVWTADIRRVELRKNAWKENDSSRRSTMDGNQGDAHCFVARRPRFYSDASDFSL